MLNGSKWIALMIAAMPLASTHGARASCLNLSGDYVIQGEDGDVHIAIEQHQCDRIEIIRRNNYLGTTTSETHKLRIDGQEQEDSPWFGGREQYRTSAKFVGPELQIRTRTTGGSNITLIYSLTPSRDLLEESRIKGHGVPLVAKRQK